MPSWRLAVPEDFEAYNERRRECLKKEFHGFSVVHSQDLPWLTNEQSQHANQGPVFVTSAYSLQ